MEIKFFWDKKKEAPLAPPRRPSIESGGHEPYFDDSMRPDPFEPANGDYEMLRRMQALDRQIEGLSQNQKQLGVKADDAMNLIVPILEKLKMLRDKQKQVMNRAEREWLETNYQIEALENIIKYHTKNRDRMKVLGKEIDQFQAEGQKPMPTPQPVPQSLGKQQN
jgi:hypothetical protein